MIKMIAGLGNPGKEYEKTRHNIGFDIIDKILESLDSVNKKVRLKSIIYETNIGSNKILLVKPQTYMNLSGEAISEIISWYKIDIENCLVIVDDIDLPPGKIRIRQFGSPGTHNGLKNIVQQLNNSNFPRMRIGVGSDKGNRDLKDFVLGKYESSESAENILNAINIAKEAALFFAQNSIQLTMNRYNTPKEKNE